MKIDRDKIMQAISDQPYTQAIEYIQNCIMAAMNALADQIDAQTRQTVITPEIKEIIDSMGAVQITRIDKRG